MKSRVQLFLGAIFELLIIGINSQGRIHSDPTYVVVTPSMIRPNQDVVLSATILKLELSNTFTIRAVIRHLIEHKQAEEVCSTQHTFTRTGTHSIILKTPSRMTHGNYTIRISGFSDPSLAGLIFTNETKVYFDSKQISVFILTAKAFYSQKQTVRMRIIPLTTGLKPVLTSMDVSMVNANGIIIKEWYSLNTNVGGVVSLSYPLSKHFVGYGNWTIRVECLGHVYTKHFQVEEYYGPRFHVRVKTPNYIFQNSPALTGKIDAWWINTLDVRGNATITVDFLHGDDSPMPNVKPFVKEIAEYNGGTKFAISREELALHIGGESSLIGKQLRVTANILDWVWNANSNGFSTTRVFSDDIFLKFLGGRVWTFKPNVPFKIYIAAQRADQSMMSENVIDRTIELVITSQEKESEGTTRTELVQIPKSSIVEFWLRPKSDTERITVTARYGGRLNTEQILVATRHWSPNNHYLQISTTTSKPAVGNFIIFSIQTNTFIDYVYYYIVSSGNIILSDRLEMHSRNKLLSIALSRQMSPDAKIVAFYVAPDGQVAADSLQFHVDATKLHTMKISIGRGKDLSSEAIKIGLKTRPLSYVGVSFNRIEFYNMGGRNHFTWEEINRELSTYGGGSNKSITQYWKKDGQVVSTFRAPTPSFAHDANSTFFYSGLYIFTDANVSAVYTSCNQTKGDFPCMDGQTCYNYKQMCDFSPSCAMDHRDEMGCAMRTLEGQLEDSPDHPLSDDRSLFRCKHIHAYQNDQSFGWQEKFTKQSGGNAITIKASPIGITWKVDAFALNQEHGLALASPIIQPFFMWIFMKVQGQDKVRLGEILSLRILISNKWTQPVDVLISIPASKDYQVIGIDRDNAAASVPISGEQQILVPVFEKSKRQIYVPVEPLRTGSISIPIKLLSVVGGHSSTHKVQVRSEGIRDKNITNYQVDLRMANSERLPDLWISVPEEAQALEQRLNLYVPGSPESYVNVIGDIVGLSFFPKAKNNLQTTNLVGKQYYSGSEATFNFAINLYTMNMMRSVAELSNSKVLAITANLNLAMQEMLSYLQLDGSFLEFRWSLEPSTWLACTALEVMVEGVKVQDLGNAFQMPSVVVNLTAGWLVSQQDNTTGIFQESGAMHNRMYSSKTDVDINGEKVPGNLALTALCVSSLQKAASVTSLNGKALQGIKIGAAYLSKQYRMTEDPLEMAIVTNALFITGQRSIRQQALSRLRSMNRTVNGMSYWSTEEIAPIQKIAVSQDTTVRLMPKKASAVGAYTVTATSYALLAYMQNSESEKRLDSIQKFLQEQHLSVGGFYSTQDTLVAVKALKMLANMNQDRTTYDMTFDFTSDQDVTWRKIIHLNKKNWFDLQRFQTPSHWGSIKTTVKGHGIALVQLETSKTVDDDRLQLKQPPIRGVIDLGEVNYDIVTRGFNHSLIDFKICPRWNGESERSGMVVVEVSLPSGYKASNWGSQKIVTKLRGSTTLRAAEHLNGLEVFYFDYINKTRLNCVEFTSFRAYPVANVAELTRIKVYEYYEPANFLLTFYEKVELVKLTVCLVCGSYQCPYCPFYNSARIVSPGTPIVYLTSLLVLLIYYKVSARNH